MKLCQIYNIASHYRKKIYSLIDDSFDCSLYASESRDDIKTMDLSTLKGDVHIVKTWYLKNWNYQSGIPCLAFRKYDAFLVTGESRSFSTWIFLLISKILNRKVFLWTHGWYGKETGIYKFANKLMLNLSTGVFLYGDYARDLLIKEGLSKDKLFVVHNSLDYDKQLSIRKSNLSSNIFRDHFENDNPVLIFIGRLTPVKKLDLLLDAMEILKRNGNPCNAVFVGNGKEKENLQKLAKINRIDENVWFYGESYDERANAELIFNSDICVAPGNIGLTAMHVMMFGCPAITHNDFSYQMPEFEAIKEGLTGAFFEKGNPESLAAVIAQWMNSANNRRDEIRENCYREIDEQWNPYRQIEIFKSVLNSYAQTPSN